jgi:hypothetical protein
MGFSATGGLQKAGVTVKFETIVLLIIFGLSGHDSSFNCPPFASPERYRTLKKNPAQILSS